MEQRVQGNFFLLLFAYPYISSEKCTSQLKPHKMLPSSSWISLGDRNLSVVTSVVKIYSISTPREYFSFFKATFSFLASSAATQPDISAFGTAEGLKRMEIPCVKKKDGNSHNFRLGVFFLVMFMKSRDL